MKPVHTKRMDRDMHYVLERMDKEALKPFRLMGGTALALYLDHRDSEDLDLFSWGQQPEKEKIFKDLNTPRYERRGEGSNVIRVDALSRTVKCDIADASRFHPVPFQAVTVLGPHGIKVAGLEDIIIGKIHAGIMRRTTRDIEDLNELWKRTPEEVIKATSTLLKKGKSIYTTTEEMAKRLLDMSWTLRERLRTEYPETVKFIEALRYEPAIFTEAKQNRGRSE